MEGERRKQKVEVKNESKEFAGLSKWFFFSYLNGPEQCHKTGEKENLRFGLVNFTATKGLRYPLVFS
jgi:hypothetical protein